ncbi:FLAP-like endonuclease XPG [Indivirus ILV1]|uniref:FLAP-like endonuclease XPG n=1 Tax=Indivirus ILV1 TaxID=1977633 RepID=A0A1V0SD24_9VIRU|nr:FLAP-like endonuclease XPG [Indivirus ILV1]
MGIRNLIKVIQKYAPTAIKNTKIDKYKNKILAIDANLLIYKMIYAIRKQGYDLKNDDIITTHIHSLMLKIKGFIKYGITPVFVFDGIAPNIKEETLKKRSEFQKIMQLKYYKAVTQDEKKKYYFMKSEITYNEITDCMNLIELFGYTIINAPEEADSQLADLIIKNKVNYIVTDDMDILTFGGTKIIKNFSIDKKKFMQEINLNKFKKLADLTQNQIIDISIILGCDYIPGFKGIGPVKSYNLIKKYDIIDNVLKKEKLNIYYDYTKAQKYFKNPPVIDSQNIKINRLNINKQGLKEFLEKFKYKKEYITKLFDMYLQ